MKIQNKKLNTEFHPCFNKEAKALYARVHLPVAPECNIQCRFCNRKYNCLNENRPGVSGTVLSPGQAMEYLDNLMQNIPNISVVGIAGPGDAFATPEKTMETIYRVRETYPRLLFCIASNGFGIEPYIDELAEYNVSHITITVNAVDPNIGKDVYAWARDGKRIIRGYEAAEEIIKRQLRAIKKIKEKGMIVKVNSILIPWVNEGHIVEIAKTVSKLGVDIFNCMPLCPVEGTDFENVIEPSAETVAKIRRLCSEFIPQMYHCTRCRADAAGLLGCANSQKIDELLLDASTLALRPEENRPYYAVASMEGILVNQHLGEAEQLYIYRKVGDRFILTDKRKTPPAGVGDKRWEDLADILSDCSAVLVSGIGQNPRTILNKKGVKTFEIEGMISEGLKAVSTGKGLQMLQKRAPSGCGKGVACSGSGAGCG